MRQNVESRLRAEVVGRLDEPEVHALERRVQRQDHERQESVDQAEDDRPVGVGELMVASETERAEHRVGQAVVVEDELPRVHADEVARPERQDHEPEEQVLPPSRRTARSRRRAGNPMMQTADRGQRGVGDRAQEDGQERRVERVAVVASSSVPPGGCRTGSMTPRVPTLYQAMMASGASRKRPSQIVVGASRP